MGGSFSDVDPWYSSRPMTDAQLIAKSRSTTKIMTAEERLVWDDARQAIDEFVWFTEPFPNVQGILNLQKEAWNTAQANTGITVSRNGRINTVVSSYMPVQAQ